MPFVLGWGLQNHHPALPFTGTKGPVLSPRAVTGVRVMDPSWTILARKECPGCVRHL